MISPGLATGAVRSVVVRFPQRFAIAAAAVAVFIAVGIAVAPVVVFWRNDVVEPFTDRHAGLTRGVAGGFARFWTEAS
jgi:hypothetical protein